MEKRVFKFKDAHRLYDIFIEDLLKFEDIKKTFEGVETKLHKCITEIKKDIALKALSNIKVSAIPGLGPNRTEFFHSQGLDNLAKLYKVNAHRLKQIYGVGDKTAERILKYVKETYNNFFEKAKIKLSFDNQNSSSTKLVSLIFKTFLIKEKIDFLKDFKNSYIIKIRIKLVKLRRCENILYWLFSNHINKVEANNAYLFLKDLEIDENYKGNFNSIKYLYSRIVSIGPNEAWLDFKKDPIRYNKYLEQFYVDDDITISNIKQSEYIETPLLKEIEHQELSLNGLKTSLRNYQVWGTKYIVHQKRVLLGDEMGLGKTVEAIASLVHLRNNGASHFLVICPAGVLINWTREVKKHSDLNVIKIYEQPAKDLIKWQQDGGVAITTYGMLKNIYSKINFNVDCVVIDEAHYIKNPDSLRTSYSSFIISNSKNVLLMTGTALENRVEEMIFLISLLNLNLAKKIDLLSRSKNVVEFRRAIASIYCRRKREEVLDELPSLIEKYDWCKLNQEEEKVYKTSVLFKDYFFARRLSWNIGDLNKSSKAQRLKEIIDEAKSENRKVLIFSFFLDTLNVIKDFLKKESCYGIIEGKIPSSKRQQIIDDFEKGPAGSVLISQIEAGGTGLNIQAASVVVICEPQFKPSTENQAISRAYRMGQARNVIVHRLLCENTIDEHLIQVLKEKQHCFDEYAEKSEANRHLQQLESKINSIFKDEYDRIAKDGDIEVKSNGEYYLGLLRLSYKEIVDKLIEKYGRVNGDYFINDTFSSKNTKISRSKEGLECHHIDENIAINLSNSDFARNYPFSYQKAERLVYCNVLEHFLLHIKIAEETAKENESSSTIKGIGGALNFLVRLLNDFYSGRVYEQQFYAAASRVIAPDFESYIEYLKYFIKVIKKSPLYSSMQPIDALAVCYNGEINKLVEDRIKEFY